MATVSVRYFVDDVDTAIAFYRDLLGFEVVMHPAPPGALSSSRRSPRSSIANGGAAMPDGRLPEPGGWNRFQLEVADLDAEVDRLRRAGATFRNEIVEGVGGRQILVDDPAGNCVELFEPGQR